MDYSHPGKLFVKQFGPAESADDVQRFVRFLRAEAQVDLTPPIDLTRIFARFGIPQPRRIPLPNLQGMLVNPERGIILINQDDPETRQRFTEAHELMELLFSALHQGSGWAAREAGGFNHSTKERLCNEGAAELLMPRTAINARIAEQGLSYSTARLIATDFAVSVTAALVQMARVGPGCHAVVVWRRKNKPKEMRSQISPQQTSLFGDVAHTLPPKKLRVEWSLSTPSTPYIPPDKSIPDQSSIGLAWAEGVFVSGHDYLDLGGVQGTCMSENNPFEVEGERHVLSLIHLPGDSECAQR